MNTLLRKEFRLLLPAWIAALAAATMPLWTRQDYQGWAVPCFGLTALFLGLTPFGQEMNWGTFGLLLSQPEKRQRFWRIKAGLLGLALLSAWGLFALCWWIGTRHADQWFLDSFGSFADMAGASGLLALLAFSGGLWSTLLLRDVTTAFFVMVLIPAAILGAFGATSFYFGPYNERLIYLALEVYAVAGFFVARHLFLRAQDVPWTGGQISVMSARGWPFRWLGFGFREGRGPWFALIYKELQLQEITVILVPVLALVHLAALAAGHFASEWADVRVYEVAAMLWMVVPFVVGCVAVAEERRYNTLESLLCLPVRKRTQFAVKFVVVMALGTVLGGVFPWMLENMGGNHGDFSGFEALKAFVMFASAITAISFFASTMSRGMLQAFVVALLFPILSGVIYGLVLDGAEVASNYVGYEGGFPFIAWLAFAIAYLRLSFKNYTSLQTGWRLWAGNFIRCAAVFVCVLLLACVANAAYLRLRYGSGW